MGDFKWLDRGKVITIGDAIAKYVAGEVLADAVARAPVDTGTLARSLTMQPSGTKGTWQVGTNVFYGLFVEFGTRRMAAQPYLGPALEAARRRYT